MTGPTVAIPADPGHRIATSRGWPSGRVTPHCAGCGADDASLAAPCPAPPPVPRAPIRARDIPARHRDRERY